MSEPSDLSSSNASAAMAVERAGARMDAPAGPNQQAWRRFRRNRPAVLAAWFLGVLGVTILLWPLLPKLPDGLVPRAMSWSPVTLTDSQFHPPSRLHWFGTDVHGRDLLSRVLDGTRVSLLVGAVGAAVSLLIGVSWGALAGYLGGRWDNGLMRIVDILYSLPSIVFVIVLITTLEVFFKSWLSAMFSSSAEPLARLIFLFVGLGAVSWLTMARIVRGQVLSLREHGFIDASRVLGASHARILLRHIIPNISGIIIVYVTLTIPAVILYESFLSFLGLGIQPPFASLGSLMAEGAAQINPIRIYWWVVIFPGTVLLLALLALNFLGDGLRDALDPRDRNG